MSKPCRACGKPGKYWYSYELSKALGLLEWEGIYLCRDCLKQAGDEDEAERIRRAIDSTSSGVRPKRRTNRTKRAGTSKSGNRNREAKSRARSKRSKGTNIHKSNKKAKRDNPGDEETPLDILGV